MTTESACPGCGARRWLEPAYLVPHRGRMGFDPHVGFAYIAFPKMPSPFMSRSMAVVVHGANIRGAATYLGVSLARFCKMHVERMTMENYRQWQRMRNA